MIKNVKITAVTMMNVGEGFRCELSDVTEKDSM